MGRPSMAERVAMTVVPIPEAGDGRTTADIVRDLRDMKRRWAELPDDENDPSGETLQEFRNRVDREAADRLDKLDAEVAERDAWNQRFLEMATELSAILNLRPDCPVCGGTHRVDAPYRTSNGNVVELDCPACVDGKVSVEQLAATWRAVWAFEFRELQWGDEYDAGAQAAIAQIREVTS